ncbi:MAG: DNA mismatch repair protein MutS [Acidobacteriota bacterium]|nr:DNA mismatch repair protein MutS [Acidobacteriota bacterium]
MMQQFHRIKADHDDAIVFFRLGDFYEMFFEDAEVASPLLEITLTARNKGKPSEAPMCGVPARAADSYIARLLGAGLKVAIVEQVGEPAGKGAMDREVVRVMTPGTLVEDNLLFSRKDNYLVSVFEDNDSVGTAALELSTGEFVAAQFVGEDRQRLAREEVSRLAPREICVPDSAEVENWLSMEGGVGAGTGVTTWSPLPTWAFEPSRARGRLCEHFQVSSLVGYDLDDCDQAVGAAGALLSYVAKTQKAPLHHIHSLRRYREREYLQLDSTTRRTLEIFESWQDRTAKGSLLDILDATLTAMGGRCLRKWLLRPLRDPVAINHRLRTVAAMHAAALPRAGLRASLGRVRDLERLTARTTMGSATPRDLAALRVSLESLPKMLAQLKELDATPIVDELLAEFDPCGDIAALIEERLADEPAAAVSDGGVIRDGFDEGLDTLRNTSGEGKDFIATLQAQERDRTGISSLKVGFNKVFGYYIEVSKANLGKVPEEFIRKQTLTNAERFITPELKKFEQTVLSAEERIGELEARLFVELRELVSTEASRLHQTAAFVATVDVLACLAEVAALNGYVEPIVDDGRVLEIHQGRHPVVEMLQDGGRFVPNDSYMDDGAHRIQLLTGPNMGGKSTYLRQVALITIMAQMGSFVPAESARVGVFDRIFTRVGASDNLARGASTFLVEMQETANILHNATPASLVILDEVGRGTSTYDGLALAWAVVEYLEHQEKIAPRALFATHYHELTSLEGVLPSLRNLNVAAQEIGDGVVFLYRVEPGAADRSYGIHVGRLAGLPRGVVERAGEILCNLEATDSLTSSGATWARSDDEQLDVQMDLHPVLEHPLVAELRERLVDELTPLEALNLVSKWKAKWGSEHIDGD